jgi:hypothetical protein
MKGTNVRCAGSYKFNNCALSLSENKLKSVVSEFQYPPAGGFGRDGIKTAVLNKFLHLFRVHTGQGRNIIVGVIKLTCRDLYPRRVLRERATTIFIC